ncbi:hypothetical protein [Sphingomonas sp. G-3-2-10]|uniref:hypothetical protein n=1 Tax=Sphingomonas sp. G-3-2-10 TaxID=2728838 RepID=UPI00146D2083|nr:hypothetical protein [Sphingomonas sp. G-3-2-10]NML06340.1 hypothetical protein [Sphingomonas sp. G-3-2-10]
MLQCTVRATPARIEAWEWVIGALAAEMGEVAPQERAALIEALMAQADTPARALLERIAARLEPSRDEAGLDPYLPFMFPND